MKRFVATFALACWAAFFAPSASAAQTPHPAVVRVIAMDSDGMSLGTGCLVAIDAGHGMVVTNWHVVRDAAGTISVLFPDGFSSLATVLRTDKDWDLAALAIERPRVAPMAVSIVAPKPGDLLTIAGYGSNSYRAVAGRCTEYLSPGGNLPAEIVEVDVPARLGDSGGPIWNSNGELAGVLFGAAGTQMFGGYTMGSYCGRVRRFLAAAYVDFRRLPDNRAVLAQTPPPFAPLQPTAPAQIANARNSATSVQSSPIAAMALPPPPSTTVYAAKSAAANASMPHVGSNSLAGSPPGGTQTAQAATIALAPLIADATQATPAPSAEQPLEQIKTVLAGIGVIAVLFHGVRMLGAAVD